MQITLGHCSPFSKIGREDPLQCSVATDQVVRCTIMAELRLCRALEFWDNALSQHLAELDAPLSMCLTGLRQGGALGGDHLQEFVPGFHERLGTFFLELG